MYVAGWLLILKPAQHYQTRLFCRENEQFFSQNASSCHAPCVMALGAILVAAGSQHHGLSATILFDASHLGFEVLY